MENTIDWLIHAERLTDILLGEFETRIAVEMLKIFPVTGDQIV
jgi:hypothetical protein